MQISKNNNEIEIRLDRADEIAPMHINQIKYYGFLKGQAYNTFLLADTGHYEEILKLLDYFERQGIAYTLCPLLQKIKHDEIKTRQEFSELKENAQKFKDGNFDEAEFNGFCKFVNASIKRKLKPHQIKAAYHHYLLKNAANFSVPGSGKTSTLLTVYEKLRLEKTVDILFVVGPLSSFTAWKNEFKETLGREPKILILSGRSPVERATIYYNEQIECDVLLISFPTFTADCKGIGKFFAQHKVFLVIDEAHYMKQPDGKWASAIIENGVHAKAKFILTGTPCPKSYSDLFNLFDLLYGRNTAITIKEKTLILESEKAGNLSLAQSIVKEKLDPLFYRVRKAELGLTEPVFNEPLVIDMNDLERKIYDSIFQRISELTLFDDEKNISTLLNLKKGRIIRLRQMISYPRLLCTAIDNYDENLLIDKSDLKNAIVNYDKFEMPAKLEKLLELIEQIQKKDAKIVIWTNFIGTIGLIEGVLRKNGLNCAHIDGATPAIEKAKEVLTREKIINEFLKFDSCVDILIANPGACAESISLHTTCHHAIYFDLSYNCAQYLQSLDRIHRVGGSETQKAHYYFLQYRNTIDSDIFDNLQKKKEKMFDIIEHDSDIYKLDINIAGDESEEQNAYNRILLK
jgi:SNF2 family DNA or RNA helicase